MGNALKMIYSLLHIGRIALNTLSLKVAVLLSLEGLDSRPRIISIEAASYLTTLLFPLLHLFSSFQ